MIRVIYYKNVNGLKNINKKQKNVRWPVRKYSYISYLE